MAQGHRGARLDERRDQEAARCEKLHAIVNKIGYPDNWRDYASSVACSAATSSATSSARSVFESRRDLAKIGKPLDRGEWVHDAADGQRLLQPADERHQLPRRHPAAAALRPEDGRRAELRQHRRHHRPRADPRLRRRGPQVRRARATSRTGGPRRTRKAFEERAAVHRRPVRAVHRSSTTSRSTASSRSARTSPTSAASILAWMAWKDETAGKTLRARRRLTPEQRFFVGFAQWACENERPENLRVQRASPTRTRRASTASTAWWSTCRSSSRRSPASRASRWSRRSAAGSGEMSGMATSQRSTGVATTPSPA